MPIQNEIEEFSKAIKVIFAEDPLPLEDELTTGHFEAERLKILLKGVKWNTITREQALDLSDDISFLSPKAFRYYIPALMHFTINNYQEMNNLPMSLMIRLTPPTYEQFTKYLGASPGFDLKVSVESYQRRVSQADFSYEEIEIIIKFLELYPKINTSPKDFMGELELLPHAMNFWQTIKREKDGHTNTRS